MNFKEKARNSDVFKYGSKVYHPIRDTNYRYNVKTDTVYFERSNGTWKEMPNEEISDIM